MSLTLSRSSLIRTENFIAGHWVGSDGGSTFGVHNPADLRQIASVPDSTHDDAWQAADSAQSAFKAWKSTPAKRRGQLLKQWHALVMSHQDDLGRLISLEQGKPLAEGRGEIQYAASYIEWFAEEAPRIEGDLIEPSVDGRRMLAVREPVGVVAVVTPWNFPAAMIARKMAPALAAGCTVVAKPAEDTPLTSLALIHLAEEAGIPAGVINVVCASRECTPAVADAWLRDTRVRKISFTGSTPVGKQLARESAATLKKLSLELGGNAPFIVFDDADLDAAVEGLMASKFRNGGQTCVCPNRVYVHETVFNTFAYKLTDRVAALRVGPASETDSQIGPMINTRAVEKIMKHIDDAVAKGGKILVGGQQVRTDIGPNYVAPTVLADVSSDAQLCQEETFGPVVPLCRFTGEEEVIGMANNTPYGLAGYFYSGNISRIWRVADALETGIVGINEGVVASEVAPFGGIKESGYGREGSKYGLDDYMHIKYLCQGSLG
ncbi:NAD-dependent succinate-semialdehyde dehydrogenase [Aidingimonas halophila]|uniref:Succinate semialdehyde dehydrogenase n=1 Tax=Aidingimonas halophila TaxID=574349 RepID=A0A1H2SP03_9GAMM|nr:NAD-dependent succinate-semialdehyde dehydrogenase [Aidingimonas halophila]GHC17363.1 NAD-dependent succinate-semialdehyde dehydrogenase [Aidingimonas halophila]SDW33185.1 succinate semialdehyde dehydrogenase [Aidingimonas halophila]